MLPTVVSRSDGIEQSAGNDMSGVKWRNWKMILIVAGKSSIRIGAFRETRQCDFQADARRQKGSLVTVFLKILRIT